MKHMTYIAQLLAMVGFGGVYEIAVNGSDSAILSPVTLVALVGFGVCGIIWMSHAMQRCSKRRSPMDDARMANLLAECRSILARLERDGPTPELRHEIAGYREAVLDIKKASSKAATDEPAEIKTQHQQNNLRR